MFRWSRMATIQVREKSGNFVVGVGNSQKGLVIQGKVREFAK